MENFDIENRKKYDAVYKRGQQQAKNDRCMICGKPCSSFCQSHTLPRMVLKNISQNGYLNTAFWQYGDKNNPEVLKPKIGIKKAGVFYLICNECDNMVFKEYEDEKIFEKQFSDNILNLITLKTSLYMYYKYSIQEYVDNKILEGVKNKRIIDLHNAEYKQAFKNDIDDCMSYMSKMHKNPKYKVLFWKRVGYKIPIATQTCYGLRYNFKGDMVHENPTVYLLLCPFDRYSIICLYCKNDAELINQIAFPNNVSWIKKLSLISNLLISNTEDYFASEKLEKKLSEEDKKTIYNMAYGLEFANFSSIQKNISYMTNSFSYPNLLVEKYCVE